MKQQIKAFMPILAVLLLNIINPQKARAEEYLWNPTLAWEDSTAYSSVAGMKLIKNDEQIIYFADGVIYLRDTKTGKLLAKSEKFNQKEIIDKFSMSDDFQTIYAIYINIENPQQSIGMLFQFDAKTLKVKRKMKIPPSESYNWRTYDDGRSFRIDYIIGAYYINNNDFRLIYRTIPPSKAPWEQQEVLFGICIVKIDPNADSVSFSQDNTYKILFYEQSRAEPREVVEDFYNYGMLILKDSSYYKRLIDINTTKDVLKSEQFFSFSPNGKYISIFQNTNIEIKEFLNMKTIKQYDKKKLIFEFEGLERIVFLLLDNNPNHIFSGYIYQSTPKTFLYFDANDEKLKPVMNFTTLFNQNKITNKNTTMLFNTDHIQAYNLNPKSSVENHNELIPTLKSDKNTLYIPYENNLPKRIIFYDNSGKEIYSTTKDFKVTENEIICDISNLQNGVYLIKVEFENNNVSTFKFVKGN